MVRTDSNQRGMLFSVGPLARAVPLPPAAAAAVVTASFVRPSGAAATVAAAAHSSQKVKFCGYICQSFLFQRDFPRHGCRRRRRHYRLSLSLSSSGQHTLILLSKKSQPMNSFDEAEIDDPQDSMVLCPMMKMFSHTVSGRWWELRWWELLLRHPVLFNHSPARPAIVDRSSAPRPPAAAAARQLAKWSRYFVRVMGIDDIVARRPVTST